MIAPLGYSLISVLIVSSISLVGVLTLMISDRILKSIIFVLVSMSAGALFGDAFIHLIPGAFKSDLNSVFVSLLILGGVLFFFILEKFLHWRHSHGIDEESVETKDSHDHSKKHIGTMIIIGNGIHNMTDGAIIAASYLISVEVGIATTMAVVLHEIPQEMGDFGLLIHSGLSKWKALWYNFLSGLVSLAGAIGVFVVGVGMSKIVPVALAFAAGGFVYIAGSDLVPEIHKTRDLKKSLVQVLSMFLGILVMILLLYIE